MMSRRQPTAWARQGSDAKVQVATDPLGNWTHVGNLNPMRRPDHVRVQSNAVFEAPLATMEPLPSPGSGSVREVIVISRDISERRERLRLELELTQCHALATRPLSLSSPPTRSRPSSPR